jgi:O-antigen chain-terminating methyltransferase
MDDQPLSLDRLLETLKSEAAWQDNHESQSTSFQPKPLPFNLAEDEQQKEQDWEEAYQASLLPDSSAQKYHVSEFIALDDESFLASAYLCLFKRPLDEEGKTGYLNLLNNGWPKSLVLASLLMSEEGRAHQVQLVGNGLFRRAANLLLAPNRFSRILLGRSLRVLSKLAEKQHVAADVYLLKQQQQRATALRKEFFQLKQKVSRAVLTADVLAEQFSLTDEKVARLSRSLHYQALDQGGQGAQTDAVVTDSSAHSNISQDTHDTSMNSEYFQQFYLAFEDACRGSQEEIQAKLESYIQYLPEPTQSTGIVMDMGCGRGEWLQILKDKGYQSLGLDNNAFMLETCRRKGLQVENTPLHQWLARQADNSVMAVTGFHIAEHLPFDYLLSLLQEIARVLQPGGCLILETPNPENILVGSHTFYHDPTHSNPLTPTLMQFTAEYMGLSEIDILRLSPYPASARVDEEGLLADRVNGHLCGPQDFALLARKPYPAA